MEIKKYVVSNDKSVYEAWPDLLKTKTGKLICVFSECTAHTDRTDSRIAYCESFDRGRSWSEKKYLCPKMKKDNYYNCARISQLKDGRIAIIADRIYGWETDGRAEQHIWISEDDGNTWEKPPVLPFCGIVPDRFLQLSTGRMIVSAHYMGEKSGKLEQYLWYSDDDGKTWSKRVTVAADSRYNLCEACIVECRDKTLVAFMRENSGMGYDCMKATSNDGGQTWSEAHNFALPGCHRPTAGFLNDGKMFLTYRFLQGGAKGEQNVFAAIFDEDSAKTAERRKQGVRIIPIDYDRNVKPDQGYTGWVQFDDGEIYIVNYIKDNEEKAQIRGYSVYEKEFVLE